jgi:molecular chaperone DnaK
MNEHGDKLDENTKKEINDALEAAKKVDAEADVDVLKEQVTNLSGASMKIGEAIYAKKGDNNSENSDEPKDEEKKPENAQEAEFTEKKK